jgi:hypothetical protein
MHSYAIVHLYVVPCQVKLHHALHHVVSCNLLLMSYLTRLGCVAVSKPCHLSCAALFLSAATRCGHSNIVLTLSCRGK